MVSEITVKLDKGKLNKIVDGATKLSAELKQLPHDIAQRQAKDLRAQFIWQTKKAPRKNTASRMRAQKKSTNVSEVLIPQSASHLDSMKPHYVSLKRGRAITRWAQQNFDGKRHKNGKGLSGVRIGPRGGIKGFLYVSSDPFIEKALLRSERWTRQRFDNIVNKYGG